MQPKVVSEIIRMDILLNELMGLPFTTSDFDNDRTYKTVNFLRKSDSTLYARKLSSNPDVNNNYQTIVIEYYDEIGTTMTKKITWTFTYDENGIETNGDYILEVF